MEPVWSRDGRELFYRNGDQTMAVAVETNGSFLAGTPQLLFTGTYDLHVSPCCVPNYDVAPDGQRFVMVKPEGQSGRRATTRIEVVLNWLEELKARVPVP